MLLSRRLSKRFKEEEHKCTGRAAYDDLISRMHSGLQETLEEIEQLPMSEQASFHVMRVQNGASAVLILCLTAKGMHTTHCCSASDIIILSAWLVNF